MRKYSDLATMLTFETDVKDPQESSKSLLKNILGYAPELEYLMLFVGPDPEHPWLLVPGPSDGLKSLEDAKHCRLGDGRFPVAYWKHKP